jgi:putative membrane protein
MSGGERTFFQENARARVTAAIKEIELQTSAEVVVAVRNSSGLYRDVDYLFGFGASIAALLVLLFHPHPFALEGMPLDLIAAFAAGALFCAYARPLRRALAPRKRMDASCLVAARAAFVELGVGRTKDRNGIFVLVSLFERRVKVVADVGIDPAKLGGEWGTRVVALEGSLARGASIDRFLEALRALGPPLGASMPRSPDDVNELPDEVAE